MKLTTLKAAAVAIGCAVLPFSKTNAQAINEGFENITTLTGAGWFMQNNSTTIGSTSWFQGNTTVFSAQAGTATSYIGANFNNTTGANTISNWLLTPNRTFRNGDVITFYTRCSPDNTYPDRLQVRLSTNGASTNVGTGSSAVGDFTTVLLEINPTQTTSVYPFSAWAQYTITISGLPAPTSGRVAFRYFVTNGGPSGSASDYIGIDEFVYTPYVCPSIALTASGALTGGTAGSAYNATLTQTGLLGTPNFAVTAGTLPPGMSIAPASGAISGTPTATGTFNFTATASDASGCSGSQSYSITVACPANPTSLNNLPSLCSDASTYALMEGLPAGGTYSGTGVTGSSFDPVAGTQAITYTYIDAYGCSHASSNTITVNAAPSVTQDALAAVCEDAGPVTLAGGSPAGGTYSGTGVTGGDFDPAAGTQTVTYTYTDANNCSSSAAATITVNTLPAVTQDAIAAVCEDAGAVTLEGGLPLGGTYSGTGVSGTSFDPAAGTQAVAYTYTDANGCTNSAETTITVNPLPEVTLSLPVATMCVYNNALTLGGGLPASGSYSGTGVAGGMFTPATAGTGTHAITYSFTDGNGCAATATDNIVVDACLGVEENAASALQVFPNPATGKFTVAISSGELQNATVSDMHGKLVLTDLSTSQGSLAIDLTQLEAGVYFLNGTVNNQAVSVRLIKQ